MDKQTIQKINNRKVQSFRAITKRSIQDSIQKEEYVTTAGVGRPECRIRLLREGDRRPEKESLVWAAPCRL